VTLDLVVACLAAVIWIYLLAGRSRFWLGWREPVSAPLATYPAVVAVIPARNEAAVIGDSLRSLLQQDYPGRLRVVIVDDHSRDGTAAAAREAAASSDAAARLDVVAAPPLPAGWVGKVAAMEAGFRHVHATDAEAAYVLFTDADIRHGRDAVRRLVERADSGRLDLVSLMVRLKRSSFAERALVPAFVFFFRMLYPFAQVNDPQSPVAGAAGGCMLLRRVALERINGLSEIKSEIIDDCALARAIKRHGAIRLDVADISESLRGYHTLGDMWRLIARTAYTELRYSPLRLLGTVIGMSLVFLAPPLLALFCGGCAAVLGLAAWIAMSLAFVPCLRYYRASPAWAPLLPLIALFYTGATLDSARRHWAGRGGEWKERFQSEIAGS
jgi:hopene-associated glycosyltransferase HpnB